MKNEKCTPKQRLPQREYVAESDVVPVTAVTSNTPPEEEAHPIHGQRHPPRGLAISQEYPRIDRAAYRPNHDVIEVE